MESHETQGKISLNKVILEAIREKCGELQEQGYQGNTDNLTEELTNLVVAKIKEHPEISDLGSSGVVGYITLTEVLVGLCHLLDRVKSLPILDERLTPVLDTMTNTIRENVSWAYELDEDQEKIQEKLRNAKEIMIRQTNASTMLVTLGEKDGRLIFKANNINQS